MRTVLISGGNSVIGRRLIRHLDRRRWRVIALTRRPEALPDTECIVLPMERYSELGAFIERCDAFVSLAWHGGKREELNDEEKNRFSYETIREAARFLMKERGCQRLILAGSHHEYENRGLPLEESSPEKPALAYGRYRLKLYRELRDAAERHRAHCTELRLFSVYGEDAPQDKLINSLALLLLAGERVFLRQGKQLYSFLYADDAAEAFRLTLESDTLSDGCYNVSSNCHRQLWEFAWRMRELAGSKSEIVCADAELPASASAHSIVLSGRFGMAAGWRPRTDFDSGVRKILAYYRLNGGG